MINGEKILVAKHSAFQAIRLTEDAAGLRTLRLGGSAASQSIVKLGEPRHLELHYARVLPSCLALVQNPVRILIVGLGGGTLPFFFRSLFPRMTIDIVELDPGVLEVAKEYCGFEEDAEMRVYVDDGRDFIESSRGGYDIIVLDSFGAESIPAHLTTLEFVSSVRMALDPMGVAVANIWGRASNPLYAHMLLTYRAAFEDVYIFDVPTPGTKLFAALPRRQVITRDMVIQRAVEISRNHNFDYELSGSIAGFRHSDFETIRGGCVLRD